MIASSSVRRLAPFVAISRSPRAVVLLLSAAVLLLVAACREIPQPALNTTKAAEIPVPVEREGAWGTVRATVESPPNRRPNGTVVRPPDTR